MAQNTGHRNTPDMIASMTVQSRRLKVGAFPLSAVQ
ncbi:hypothetical protein QFZ75_004087 [Streptomyces sp. V3I8]|nr:hypothetical protein [Streptomyces sp. V3I8]